MKNILKDTNNTKIDFGVFCENCFPFCLKKKKFLFIIALKIKEYFNLKERNTLIVSRIL